MPRLVGVTPCHSLVLVEITCFFLGHQNERCKCDQWQIFGQFTTYFTVHWTEPPFQFTQNKTCFVVPSFMHYWQGNNFVVVSQKNFWRLKILFSIVFVDYEKDVTKTTKPLNLTIHRQNQGQSQTEGQTHVKQEETSQATTSADQIQTVTVTTRAGQTLLRQPTIILATTPGSTPGTVTTATIKHSDRLVLPKVHLKLESQDRAGSPEDASKYAMRRQELRPYCLWSRVSVVYELVCTHESVKNICPPPPASRLQKRRK